MVTVLGLRSNSIFSSIVMPIIIIIDVRRTTARQTYVQPIYTAPTGTVDSPQTLEKGGLGTVGTAIA